MLIISKFHDYYDSSMGVGGIDKTIVFERKATDVKETYYGSKFKVAAPSFFSYGKGEAVLYMVGFCGVIYCMMKLVYNSIPSREEVYYGQDILDVLKKKKKYYFWWGSNLSIDDWVNNYHLKQDADPFFHHNAPIFIERMTSRSGHHGCYTTLNPNLKEWEFQKQVDSFTAFQNIQMFISGVLGVGNKPTIEVSDKDKLISRGFDDKWSFRNPDPPKRKQK